MKKISKYLITILSIMSFVLSVFLIWQSAAFIYYNLKSDLSYAGGIIGIIISIIFIFSGVVAFVLRNEFNEYVPLICFAIILCACMVRVLFFSFAFPDLDLWILILFVYSFFYFGIAVCIKINKNNGMSMD